MKIETFILSLLLSLSAFAQKETSNWFFGNYATAEFRNTSVKTNSAGALASEEACASISDTNGNLLFYTNGVQVWNKNLFVTPNGDNLNGTVTTAQMMIVPNPGNPNLYYIFYADGFGGPNGLQYSEFDVSLDNGLGDVVASTKNTLLHLNASEKMAAVKHCNGDYLWLVSMDFVSNDFLAHLITDKGIQAPIRSKSESLNGWCCNSLKFSPNGNRLAYTESRSIGGSSDAMLYQFDTQSGLTFLETKLPIDSIEGELQHGLSFSPNSEILYIGTVLYRNTAGNRIEVYQYDLNSSSIIQSKHTLFSRLMVKNGNQVVFGSFQNAPNGKIYIAKKASGGTSGDTLAAIHSPNSLGAASGFEFNALYLSGRTSTLGLPNFMESYFHPSANLPDTCRYISIVEKTQEKNVSLFPNPSNGEMSIHFSNPQKWISLELFDISGAALKKEHVKYCKTINRNYSDLRSGIYVLQIIGDNLNETVRISIQSE